MKKLLALIPIAVTALSVFPAHAGRIEPTPVTCWFFQGEQVELQQTCSYESISWTGGGGSSLHWEDGVETHMKWGLQERGSRPCEDTSLDGVCGTTYYRHLTTLEQISETERNRRVMNNQKAITCIQVQNKSVCWLR